MEAGEDVGGVSAGVCEDDVAAWVDRSEGGDVVDLVFDDYPAVAAGGVLGDFGAGEGRASRGVQGAVGEAAVRLMRRLLV